MKHGDNQQTATAFINFQDCKGSNLTSYGSEIFSYRTQIATHQDGAILLTYKDYSSTTQRHKLHIRRAAAAANVATFEVPFINPDEKQHSQNYLYLLSLAAGLVEKMKRARKPETRRRYNAAALAAQDTAANYKFIFMNE